MESFDLGANHEMPRPLLLEGLGHASSSIIQRGPYPLQRAQWIGIDAIRNHDQDPPAILIKPFTPIEIMTPLLCVKGMLAPVVLDDQLVFRIAKVESPAPLATSNAHDEVDLRLWQPCEDDK